MLSKLLLVLALCLVKADDQFPQSLARVGQICPNPEDAGQRFVCHFSKGSVKIESVEIESVSSLLQGGDSLPGHFATDGNLYDCDCELVDQTIFPCTEDDCCKESPLINDDVGAHVDDNCPTKVGEPSKIGCVEFTGCRYDVEPCETDECCEQSPLRNPDLPVKFDEDCPQTNGDPSHGGCIEFTRCKYVDFTCNSDECCATDDRVHANHDFAIHFDEGCPTEDGDKSVIGCIAFTGCKYGDDAQLPCVTDECCREISVTNHDPTLGVHADPDCPRVDGDVSLVGCVEFTGCRYNVNQCDSDECCAKNALRNPSLPVRFNDECPARNGDVSIVGCIEFTQCQYIEQFEKAHAVCTDDACCVTNDEVPHNPNIGVHFDAECPVNEGDGQHNGCVGFTGCRVGTADACDDDLCCDINTKVNHDPRLHVHFDETCPKVNGDVSLVGCVEFTQCRYDVDQCEDTECCEKNALRNPELPVVFNPDCPKVDGDTSIVGCIEFTGCQYLTSAPEDNDGACTDDDCCRDNPEVNHNPLLAVHFDETCPTVDGETSHAECVGLTGCRYGPLPVCSTDECCKNVPVVNRDPSLNIHFDEGCPIKEGDSSLVGCVQFTGCRYGDVDDSCKSDDCCQNLKIVNHDLPVVFNADCPEKDGDVSIVGCVEFTQCQYTETFPESLSCFGPKTDACCDANPIVNHDIEVHFDDGCPEHNGDISVVGCVEFTGCKYETEPCDTQECCDANPIVNHDPSLNVHVDTTCPAKDGDTSEVGCVEFTQCRYGAVEGPCSDDECCAKNALRNPEIPVVFDTDCPAKDGDVSIIGCIEFTQCKYTTEPTPPSLQCSDDACCALNPITNHDVLLGVHFDATCPLKEGDFSVIGCVEFTGCRYGPPSACETDECCRENSITNHDPRLNVHADADCPRVDGDVSIVGCVEFTGCRYDVDQCEDDVCCEKNVLRNPELPVVFNSHCPRVDGDVSIVGCIEFTQCQYVDDVPEPQACTDDLCCAETTNIEPSTGVHFDAECPTSSDDAGKTGCIGFTGCAIGAKAACTDDDCCAKNDIVNHDPALDAHFDSDCPLVDGDESLVGCVEFTQCRYSNVACNSDECCAKNALRNPELPVVFDASCPLKNGDTSKIGCIEFTQCRYTVEEQSPGVTCDDDVCCVTQLEIDGASELGAHFDSACPTQEGDVSVIGCIGFSGCRLGADFENPCTSDECCKANPLVNQDGSLNAHFDPNCPHNDGDTSIIGCVEFTSCRYGDQPTFCTTQQCCDDSPIVNHDVEHVGLAAPDEDCPRVDGDISLIGCVEFTGCRYPAEEQEHCADQECCDANTLVNHDPSLGAHFDPDCPVDDQHSSLIGCVEFTQCRYFDFACSSDECCRAHPLTNTDDRLAVHVDKDCPAKFGDPSLVGCVEFTRCRYGDSDFIEKRNLARSASTDSGETGTDGGTSGLQAGDIAAILLAVTLFAVLAGIGYCFFCRRKKADSDYIAMDHRQSA